MCFLVSSFLLLFQFLSPLFGLQNLELCFCTLLRYSHPFAGSCAITQHSTHTICFIDLTDVPWFFTSPSCFHFHPFWPVYAVLRHSSALPAPSFSFQDVVAVTVRSAFSLFLVSKDRKKDTFGKKYVASVACDAARYATLQFAVWLVKGKSGKKVNQANCSRV